MPLENFIL